MPGGSFYNAAACRSSTFGCSQRRSRSRTSKISIVQPSKRRVELLIDADSQGIQAVREAIDLVKETEGCSVNTTVFAEPRRLDNIKWKDFVKSVPAVSFIAVPRDGVLSQSNDEVMTSTVQRLCQQSDTTCIAVFSSDRQLVEEIISLASKQGKQAVVVSDDTYKLDGHVDQFVKMGAKVLRRKLDHEPPAKVQARLHSDGTGEVQLFTYQHWTHRSGRPQQYKDVMDFLSSRDCPVTEQSLHAVAVKFWFQQQTRNQNSLVVFPAFHTLSIVSGMMADLGSFPHRWHRELAYCLPLASIGAKNTKRVQDTYGSIFQRKVLLGGGPFMLEHSDSMVASMLATLGYLDTELNHDIKEAMFVFMNNSHNKKELRRIGLLSTSAFKASQALSTLEEAFLSHITYVWQCSPADSIPRRMLLQAGRISGLEAPKHVVLLMMRKHVAEATEKGLPTGPELQTYNGLVWRMSRIAAESDPKKREIVLVHDDKLD